jgi:hypothetical protein
MNQDEILALIHQLAAAGRFTCIGDVTWAMGARPADLQDIRHGLVTATRAEALGSRYVVTGGTGLDGEPIELFVRFLSGELVVENVK